MRMLMLSTTIFLAGMFELAAQTYCGSRSSILDSLFRIYNEVIVAVGVVPNQGIIEVLASEDGSFSIIFTDQTGTCLKASGEGFKMAPIKTSGEDS